MSVRRIVYSEAYHVDIGQHVFPTEKYRLVQKRLIDENGLESSDFFTPEPAEDKDILLVHTKRYLEKLKSGTLSPAEVMRLELPYSKKLVKASYLCVGGTIDSAKIALKNGIGVHLGGGFHHAFSDHGEGFCVFNDIAIAVKRLMKDGDIKK